MVPKPYYILILMVVDSLLTPMTIFYEPKKLNTSFQAVVHFLIYTYKVVVQVWWLKYEKS